jgi:hypothetical protein
MTQWSKEVSPQNALPAYPRPQMGIAKLGMEWKSADI